MITRHFPMVSGDIDELVPVSLPKRRPSPVNPFGSLPSRTRKVLQKLGVQTPADLKTLRVSEILSVRNAGRFTVESIKSFAEISGIQLLEE